jgi:hypothetical protein
MDSHDSLLVLNSEDGTGNLLNNKSYNTGYLKNMQKDYDLLVALKEFHMNDILFEIVAGLNTIQWQEQKANDPLQIRSCTAFLTVGFYTRSQFIIEIELRMKDASAATGHTMQYIVAYINNGRLALTDNKPNPADKDWRYLGANANSAWPTLGFDAVNQILFLNAYTASLSTFPETQEQFSIYSNIIFSNNYLSSAKTTTNILLADVDIDRVNASKDYFSYYESYPVFFKSNILNSQNVNIVMKKKNQDLHDFRQGLTYSIVFIVRTRLKESIIRKELMITKKEIADIVIHMIKQQEKINKKNVEKQINIKKTRIKKII